ncbi:hypothetical protein B0H14DRAFT_2800366 [Mycena olivaceomarginata]|nr:hypothetical protein B0H14DRAFT_2800366 [Mycena olivaceomarginata]
MLVCEPGLLHATSTPVPLAVVSLVAETNRKSTPGLFYQSVQGKIDLKIHISSVLRPPLPFLSPKKQANARRISNTLVRTSLLLRWEEISDTDEFPLLLYSQPRLVSSPLAYHHHHQHPAFRSTRPRPSTRTSLLFLSRRDWTSFPPSPTPTSQVAHPEFCRLMGRWIDGQRTQIHTHSACSSPGYLYPIRIAPRYASTRRSRRHATHSGMRTT